VVCWWFPF